MFLDVEVTLICHGRKARLSPRATAPFPNALGISLEDFRRALSEMKAEILRELKEDLRSMDQRLASLEHGAGQPHLVMKADRQADKKNRERTEGVAQAVQAMHGDSFLRKKDRRRSKGLDHFQRENRTSHSPLQG